MMKLNKMQTHDMRERANRMSDTPHADLVSQVSDQFTRAFRRLRKGSAKELAPFGLTFSQSRALRVLAHEDGPMRVGELATRLEIVPRSATAMADILEEAGLAVREADPSDRRSVLVALTPEGRALHSRMREARRASAAALFGRLDAAQLSQLLDLLETLNEAETPREGSAS
jgi:DNA-binding MarR family transcriptional regulator